MSIANNGFDVIARQYCHGSFGPSKNGAEHAKFVNYADINAKCLFIMLTLYSMLLPCYAQITCILLQLAQA